MISPKKEKLAWIFDFVCQQKTDGFQRSLSSEEINERKLSMELSYLSIYLFIYLLIHLFIYISEAKDI